MASKDDKFLKPGFRSIDKPKPNPDTLFAGFRAAEAWHQEQNEADRPLLEALALRRRKEASKKPKKDEDDGDEFDS